METTTFCPHCNRYRSIATGRFVATAIAEAELFAGLMTFAATPAPAAVSAKLERRSQSYYNRKERRGQAVAA